MPCPFYCTRLFLFDHPVSVSICPSAARQRRHYAWFHAAHINQMCVRVCVCVFLPLRFIFILFDLNMQGQWIGKTYAQITTWLCSGLMTGLFPLFCCINMFYGGEGKVIFPSCSRVKCVGVRTWLGRRWTFHRRHPVQHFCVIQLFFLPPQIRCIKGHWVLISSWISFPIFYLCINDDTLLNQNISILLISSYSQLLK